MKHIIIFLTLFFALSLSAQYEKSETGATIKGYSVSSYPGSEWTATCANCMVTILNEDGDVIFSGPFSFENGIIGNQLASRYDGEIEELVLSCVETCSGGDGGGGTGPVDASDIVGLKDSIAACISDSLAALDLGAEDGLTTDGEGNIIYIDVDGGTNDILAVKDLLVCPDPTIEANDETITLTSCGEPVIFDLDALVNTDCPNGVVAFSQCGVISGDVELFVVDGDQATIVPSESNCLAADAIMVQYEVTCTQIDGAITSKKGTLTITYDNSNCSPCSNDYNLVVVDSELNNGVVTVNLLGGTTGPESLCLDSSLPTFTTIPSASQGVGGVVNSVQYAYSPPPIITFPFSEVLPVQKLCGGLPCDACNVTIEIIKSGVSDDGEAVPKGATVAIDATDDDDLASCPGVVTCSVLNGPQFGSIANVNTTGGLTFDYTSPANACATDFVQYECFCDGQSIGIANHFLYCSDATPIDKTVTTIEDTPDDGSVGDNDILCSGGATSTFQLASGFTVGQTLCGDATAGVTLTAFGADGTHTLTPYGGFRGTCCFDYQVVCTMDNGVFVSDAASQCIEIEYTEARITAGELNGNGISEVCLEMIKMPSGNTAPIGQPFTINIKLPNGTVLMTTSGNVGDVGGTVTNGFPYWIGAFANGVCLDFNKKQFAIDNNLTDAQATELELEINWGGSADCALSNNTDNTAIVTCFEYWSADNHTFQQNSFDGDLGGMTIITDNGGLITSNSVIGIYPNASINWTLRETNFCGQTKVFDLPIAPEPTFDQLIPWSITMLNIFNGFFNSNITFGATPVINQINSALSPPQLVGNYFKGETDCGCSEIDMTVTNDAGTEVIIEFVKVISF